MFNTIFPKIHKEGYKFLAISVLLTFVALFFSKLIGLLLIIITVWVYYFFRDPDRISINNEDYLVSPADGVVLQVMETNGPKELNLENKKFTKVSIFMNVFDCHVNRTPCSGVIEDILYIAGKFLNASLDKASEDNERNYYKIKNSFGEEIVVVQIAGLVARRIVTETSRGEKLEQGSRIGIIRFGSRAELYFENYKPLVKVDQKTIAGETLIAKRQ